MSPVAARNQAPVPAPATWTTPQILKAGLAAIWIATLLLMGAAISGARSHREAMKTIGRDSAPSIIAAQKIRAALADMDANAANELLGGAGAKDARLHFDQRHDDAISGIVAAAENITYGEAERGPIHKMALGIGTYAAEIQTARERNSVPAWRHAAEFMDSTLLPEAQALDDANRKALDAAYAGEKARYGRSYFMLIAAALILGAALFQMQVFLARRMRRTLNPGLFLASVAAFVLVVFTGQRFGQSDRDLKVAKEDAFESIHTLWQARSLAYAANSDESRYLLDPDRASAYQTSFETKASRISGELLPNELKNITFPGEEEAARAASTWYDEYLKIDKQIRALAAGGHRAEAIALCTGTAPHQSNWAFDRFDSAIQKTLDVNQAAFDAAVKRGEQDVAGFEVIAPVAALVIALLSWLGLRPRIREYSA
jgi:hypothetical protein